MKKKSNRKEEKSKKERDIFEQFSKVAKTEYNYLIISFESRDDPEPDILCKLSDGREIAFELVRIRDKKFTELTSYAEKLEKKFNDLIKKTSEETLNKFINKLYYFIYVLTH